MKRWHLVAGVTVVVSLFASGCTSSEDRPKADRKAQAQVVGPVKVKLDEIPALAVDEADTAPAGLVGDVWTVRLPATGDPLRPGLGVVGGVRAKLTAASAGGTFDVYDALATSADAKPLYSGTNPEVPAGVLRNGGVYRYTVTTDGAQEGPYAFVVRGANPVSGAYAAEVAPESYTSGAGQMGVGLSFSTADVGSSAVDPATLGVRKGLPPGWAWQGLGSGIAEVELEEAGGYLGWSKILIVHRDGGGAEALGCRDAKGWVCSSLDGTRAVGGLHASLADATGAKLTVRDPGSGRSWQVETWSSKLAKDDTDSLKHRVGHVVSSSAPGSGSVAFTYGSGNDQITKVAWDVGPSDEPLTWTVLRKGDSRCDGPVPPGFVAVPDGAVCGWTLPSGDWMRLFFVDAGSAGPQIGRVLRLPGSEAKACAAGPYTACQDQWNLVTVTDWAWSAKGHLRGVRQPAANLSVMSGAAQAGDDTIAARLTYDDAGRVDSILAAAPSPGGPRAETDQTYSGADARFPGSTHSLQIVQSGPKVAPMRSAKAVDDGLRTVGEAQPSGGTVRTVWHRDKELALAEIAADGMSTVHLFDPYDRVTGTYHVPNGSLPASCAQGATSSTACAPAGGWEQASGSEVVYDQALPEGLLAEWYADGAMASNPVKRTAVTGFASGALQLSPPDVADLKDGGAVRITGALVPTVAPKRISMAVQGAGLPTGAVFLNDQFAGTIAGAAATATVRQTGKPLPYRFEAVISFSADPPTGLQIKDPDQGPVGVTYQPSVLRQRWGLPTEKRTVEAYPAGSGTFRAVAERSTYGDVDAPSPTASSTIACGTAGTWQAAADACAKGTVAGTVKRTLEPDGFGGARVASETSGTGQVTSYEFWGRDETPAGLPHAGDLPAGISSVPQFGLPKTTVSPSGRRTTTVYDRYGRPTCDLVGTSADAALSCTDHDALLRPVRETFRSAAANVAPVTVDYEYGVTNGSGGSAPSSITRTRSESGKTVASDVQTFTAGGQAVDYTTSLETATGGGATATTTYGYDGVGRTTSAVTEIKAAGKTSQVRTDQAYQAGTGLLEQVSVAGGVTAKVAYDPASPWLLQGVTVAGADGKALVGYAAGRDGALRPNAHTWALADGAKVADQLTLSSAGRQLGETFDGVPTTFRYDDIGRLVAATTGGTAALYGWDQDQNLICTARGLTSDAGSCNDAPGKVANTYEKGRLTASTDDAWSPGANAYTPEGDLTSLGGRKLAYDARHQLASLTRDGSTVSIERDVAGRPATYRQSGTDGSVRFAYASPDAASSVGTVAADGSARFAIQLPGGVLWRTDGLDLIDGRGNPAVSLTSAGVRVPDQPTRRYGPFGEDLTPKAAPKPAATTTTTSTTTTTAPGSTTTAPAATTTSTAESSTTTTAAGAAGDATTTTAADGGSTTTTTTEAATTTTTEAKATTTTEPPAKVETPLQPAEIHSWANRVRIDGDLMDLGARTMVPALGIFTGADPIRGGSCTAYGYTCADPVNSSDLGGTSSIPWGAIIGIAVTTLLVIFLPPVIPAVLGAELATAAAVELVSTVILSAVGSAASTIITDVIDNDQFPSWSELLKSLEVGAILGAASGAISGGALWLTRTAGEMDAAFAAGRWFKPPTTMFVEIDAEVSFFRALRPDRAVRMLYRGYLTKAVEVSAEVAASVRNGLAILGVRAGVQAGLMTGDHLDDRWRSWLR